MGRSFALFAMLFLSLGTPVAETASAHSGEDESQHFGSREVGQACRQCEYRRRGLSEFFEQLFRRRDDCCCECPDAGGQGVAPHPDAAKLLNDMGEEDRVPRTPQLVEQPFSSRRAVAQSTRLLEGGQLIRAEELVVTSAPLLEDNNFRPEVTAEVNGKYYGYLIGVVKERGRFRFQGPVRAFTAEYGNPVTVDWPDATDFLYRDSRASAAALSNLLPDASPDVSENLRLYHFPFRVGYDSGGYRFHDTVLVVYLDPVSGIRSTFTIREEAGRIAIYPLQVNGIPTQPSETSLVTVLGVATTDEIDVPIGPKFLKVNVRVQVPRHTFTAASYRNSWGRRDRSPSGSFGTSLDLPDRGDEALRLIFEEAIQAGRTGDLVSPIRFRQAYELIASAHSRLPETMAKRSRAANPGGIVR